MLKKKAATENDVPVNNEGLQGQATTPAQGQATTPAQGQATTPAQGQATTPAQGQATTVSSAPPPATVNTQKGVMLASGGISKDSLVYAERKNNLVVDYGTLPRLKASNGNFMDGDNVQVGNFIEFQVMSFNERWTVTPNSDDAPATLCRFSLDGVNLDDGSGVTVEQHIADMKTAGWAKAEARLYVEMIVNLLATEKPSPHVGSLVQLQLSPTSKKEFEQFQLLTTFKIQSGTLTVEQAERVRAEAKIATRKVDNKSWTKFHFTVAQ